MDHVLNLLPAAKMIGAGLACIAMGGAGIGIGQLWGQYMQASLRNPGAASTQFANLWIGFALCEAIALYALVIALLILYG